MARSLVLTNFFHCEFVQGATILRLVSEDGTNRLTRDRVLALTKALRELEPNPRPLIITGNAKFFSVGANLHEIAALSGPVALEFARMGQARMSAAEQFPAPVYAAIQGYCMGGGLDLAL